VGNIASLIKNKNNQLRIQIYSQQLDYNFNSLHVQNYIKAMKLTPLQVANHACNMMNIDEKKDS
jgi:hypothetical protein